MNRWICRDLVEVQGDFRQFPKMIRRWVLRDSDEMVVVRSVLANCISLHEEVRDDERYFTVFVPEYDMLDLITICVDLTTWKYPNRVFFRFISEKYQQLGKNKDKFKYKIGEYSIDFVSSDYEFTQYNVNHYRCAFRLDLDKPEIYFVLQSPRTPVDKYVMFRFSPRIMERERPKGETEPVERERHQE